MPEQFMNPDPRAQWLERSRRQREKYRNEVGPGLFQTLLGENVPPSRQVLDPYSDQMRQEYIFPSGQPDPATQALRAENDARLQQLPVEPEFVGPIPPPEPMPGQRDFMGPQPAGPGLIAEMFGESWKDRAPEPAPIEPEPQQPISAPSPELLPGPQTEQMLDDQKKRQILSVLEGLTRAGETMSRRMTSPGEIAMGLDRGPVDMTTADMLKELQEKSLAKEAGGPLLDEYNKLNDTNFTTMDQVREHRQGRKTEVGIAGTEEGIEASKAKRAAEVEEQKMTATQQKRFEAGDMSAAPKELKKQVLAYRKEWNSDSKDTRKTLRAAQKIPLLIDSGDSVGSRLAITQMVLLSGETGRLTEGDIKRMARRMGFKGYQDMVSNLIISDLNGEQKNEFRRIAKIVEEEATETLHRTARVATEGISELYPRLNVDKLMKLYLGKDWKKPKEEHAGQVEVLPTGKDQTIWVDEADVEQGVTEKIWERL